MEKSAAYILGFQHGLGDDVELEKAATLLTLLEFVPENEKQAAALIKGLSKIRALLAKLHGGVGPGQGIPTPKAAPAAAAPASLQVRWKGDKPKTIGGGGGPAKPTKRVEQKAYLPGKGPSSG